MNYKANILLVFLLLGIFKDDGLFAQSENYVKFPTVSEPVLLVDNGKEHLYASYYGINSFSANDRYATVLETDIKYELPTEDQSATLGLVDLETGSFIPLTETRSWNFQQGCMAHWLPSSPDSLIIYNDLRDGKFVSIILNVHTKQEIKTIPYPISALSNDGKFAASINFSRLRQTRSDYGYGGQGQDANMDVAFPEDDGLFLIELETGDAELIVSMADVKRQVPELDGTGVEYFNHTLFSRGDSKIFWLARAIPNRNTTSFVVNVDGTDLTRCFPDEWGGSHFDWLNDDELMVTAAYKGKQYSHILFTPGQDNYVRLGNGILDYDGHGAFSPDEQWMVTDTYPRGSALLEQKIYLMHMATHAILPLGTFVEPAEFKGHWRCDIHPRWSRSGRLIGFNSTYTGSRQAYFIKLNYD